MTLRRVTMMFMCLKCVYFVNNEEITIKTDESSINQDLKAMFEDKEFCDIIFCIDNEELPAHKALLSARCERFKAMFTSKTTILIFRPTYGITDKENNY